VPVLLAAFPIVSHPFLTYICEIPPGVSHGLFKNMASTGHWYGFVYCTCWYSAMLSVFFLVFHLLVISVLIYTRCFPFTCTCCSIWWITVRWIFEVILSELILLDFLHESLRRDVIVYSCPPCPTFDRLCTYSPDIPSNERVNAQSLVPKPTGWCCNFDLEHV